MLLIVGINYAAYCRHGIAELFIVGINYAAHCRHGIAELMNWMMGGLNSDGQYALGRASQACLLEFHVRFEFR